MSVKRRKLWVDQISSAAEAIKDKDYVGVTVVYHGRFPAATRSRIEAKMAKIIQKRPDGVSGDPGASVSPSGSLEDAAVTGLVMYELGGQGGAGYALDYAGHRALCSDVNAGAAMRVPTYANLLQARDYAPTLPLDAPAAAAGPRAVCFNCGVAGHDVAACTADRDPAGVARRARDFREQAGDQTGARYYADPALVHLDGGVVGRVSARLRRALGVQEGDALPFIPRMELWGFPDSRKKPAAGAAGSRAGARPPPPPPPPWAAAQRGSILGHHPSTYGAAFAPPLPPFAHPAGYRGAFPVSLPPVPRLPEDDERAPGTHG